MFRRKRDPRPIPDCACTHGFDDHTLEEMYLSGNRFSGFNPTWRFQCAGTYFGESCKCRNFRPVGPASGA